jgi:hypothetical protein
MQRKRKTIGRDVACETLKFKFGKNTSNNGVKNELQRVYKSVNDTAKYGFIVGMSAIKVMGFFSSACGFLYVQRKFIHKIISICPLAIWSTIFLASIRPCLTFS